MRSFFVGQKALGFLFQIVLQLVQPFQLALQLWGGLVGQRFFDGRNFLFKLLRGLLLEGCQLGLAFHFGFTPSITQHPGHRARSQAPNCPQEQHLGLDRLTLQARAVYGRGRAGTWPLAQQLFQPCQRVRMRESCYVAVCLGAVEGQL